MNCISKQDNLDKNGQIPRNTMGQKKNHEKREIWIDL